jgi:alpha-tubulin suppressor-like RCC1 family protein
LREGQQADASSWDWGQDMDSLATHRTGGLRHTGSSLALAAIIVALAMAIAASASAAPYGAIGWGGNGSGQLGNGNLLDSEVPVTVSGLSGVTAVSAGGVHSLALMSDGSVMAWGNNAGGQLGDGTTTTRDVPVPVSGLSGVTAISAGGGYSLALLSDGTVMAWGSNSLGQLGDGTTNQSDVPVPVSGLTGVTAIAAGGSFGLALLSDGKVVAWGDDRFYGELGNGTTCEFCYSTVPVSVTGLKEVTTIAAGGFHSLARLSNGSIMAWGSNEYGQLGNGRICAACHSAVPVMVSGELSGVTAISAGGNQSLALLTDGEVMEWGGLHGDTPTPVSGLSRVTAISAGGGDSLALLGDGTIMEWTFAPQAVSGPDEIVGISAGGYHNLAFGPPPPTVIHVNPNIGPAAGSTSVTITGPNGTDFSEATAVNFGSATATSFTVNSATSVTAVAPEGTGVVDVTVTTPAGTSPINPADRFNYSPAGLPEFGRCMKAIGVKEGGKIVFHGEYENGACTKPSATKEGKYNWTPGPGQHAKFTGAAFAVTGPVVTIETVGRFTKGKVTCRAETDEGEVTGPKTEMVTVTLTGCETGAGAPCQSQGAAAGEIGGLSLEGELGYIKNAAIPSVGLDLKPTGLSAPVLGAFECTGGPGQVLLEGSVIGKIVAYGMSLAHKLTFTETKGHQVPESFEAAPKDTLTIGVGTVEQCGLKMKETITSEERIEIKASA